MGVSLTELGAFKQDDGYFGGAPWRESTRSSLPRWWNLGVSTEGAVNHGLLL